MTSEIEEETIVVGIPEHKAIKTFVHWWLSTRINPHDCLHHPLSGALHSASARIARYRLLTFLDASLRGLGQAIFTNNPISGVIFLIASLINCQYCTFLGMLGLITSTLTAHLFELPIGMIQDGLYGYNGYLIGAALAIFSADDNGQDNHTLVVPVIILSMLSPFVITLLSTWLSSLSGKPSAVFTYPFQLLVWIWLLGAQRYEVFPNSLPNPSLTVQTSPHDRDSFDYDYDYSITRVGRAVIISIGQVFFFSDFNSGVLTLLGVALYSRISAVWGFIGAFVGVTFGILVGAPESEIDFGLWGYDPCLVGIALGGLFLAHSRQLVPYALIAILFCTLLHGALRSLLLPFSITPLTFAAATTNVVFTTIAPRFKNITIIPLDKVTAPEDHFRLSQVSVAPLPP